MSGCASGEGGAGGGEHGDAGNKASGMSGDASGDTGGKESARKCGRRHTQGKGRAAHTAQIMVCAEATEADSGEA